MKANTNDPSLPDSFVISGNASPGAHALHELYSIAQFYGGEKLLGEVQGWSKRYLNMASVEVMLHHPEKPDHKSYQLDSAFCRLGEHLAKQANMYRDFEETENGYRYVAKCLYFRNEFGK